MRDVDAIETYVRELGEALRRAGRPTEPLVDEARAHLYEDAAQIAAREHCSDSEAARLAVERFGGVGDVVAASRQNGRTLAASVARVTSLVLLAVAAWDTMLDLVDPPQHASEQIAWGLFVVQLIAVTWFLVRALSRHRTPRVLRLALQLNGAVAAALVVGQAVADGIASRSSPVDKLLMAEPILVLMIVQSIAALRALGQQATQVGQPSLPVEWQPPG